MSASRSSRLGRVATARTAVVVAGTTGALATAMAIGISTSKADDAVPASETSDDTGQYQAPYDQQFEQPYETDDDRAVVPQAPPQVSNAQPGPQHAQSNGS